MAGAVLSKAVAVIPCTGFFTSYLIWQRWSRKKGLSWPDAGGPEDSFFRALGMSVCGFLVPILTWQIYQAVETPTFALYLDGWMSILRNFTERDVGSGLTAVAQGKSGKPWNLWFSDFWELFRHAPLAMVFTLLGFILVEMRDARAWRRARAQGPHGVAALGEFIGSTLFVWSPVLLGLGWWIFISRFDGKGALLRHATLFVFLGAAVGWREILGSPLMNSHVGRWGYALGALLVSGVLIAHSAGYWNHRGFGEGTFSSWKEQKQVRTWIVQSSLQSGKPTALLNCGLDQSLWMSYIQMPQEVYARFGQVLSYKSAPHLLLDLDALPTDQAVAFNGARCSEQRISDHCSLEFIEGSKSELGLWRRVCK
jgi:hypothetical protein